MVSKRKKKLQDTNSSIRMATVKKKITNVGDDVEKRTLSHC